MSLYSEDRLFEEVAFVAYHFHWSHEDVLGLPHWERQRWCEEISDINERMNDGAGGSPRRGTDLRDLPLAPTDSTRP